MTLIAAAIAVAWIGLTCWRVARPPSAAPLPAGFRPTVVVVDAGETAARASTIRTALAGLADRDDVRGTARSDVVVVVHGDDAIPSPSIDRLASELARPEVGIAQPSVRARDTGSLLARLQDMEWVGLGELHGRRGPSLGALGAGARTTAYRWAALDEIDHWPSGPADDVLVAAQLATAGWQSAYAPGAVTTRDAVPSVRALLRGRVAATAGQLRALRYAPSLLLRGRWGAAGSLLGPVGVLLLGALLGVATVMAALDPDGAARVAVGARGARLVVWYLVLFAPAWVAGFTYWTRNESIGLARSIAVGHLFVVFSLHWVLAAWIALLGMPFRREAREVAPANS